MKKAGFDTRVTVHFTGRNEGEKITASCAMLNTMCCAFGEAVARYEQLGLTGLANEIRNIDKDITEVLTAHRFYED